MLRWMMSMGGLTFFGDKRRKSGWGSGRRVVLGRGWEGRKEGELSLGYEIIIVIMMIIIIIKF